MVIMADDWPPAELDLDKPTIARAYDALLGGKDNFAADRALADQTSALIPGLRESAVENRKVLVRGIRHLVGEADMDQFLDLGSGLPTVENTHQVAQRENPAARVVYVDIDPLVSVHGRALLADNDVTRVMTGDVRDPAAVLSDPAVEGFLDFSRPTVIMMVGMLHYLSPDVVDGVVAAYRDVLAPGSHLFLHDVPRGHGLAPAAGAGPHHTREPGEGWARTPAEIEAQFGDFALIEPGVTYTALWRPDAPADPDNLTPGEQLGMAGIAVRLR